MQPGFIYILTNKPHGTLYIGVTSDVARRVQEYRFGAGSKFAHRYNLHRLIFVERHDDITLAIQRETSLKRWKRAWKDELISSRNPDWNDLFEQLL